MKTELIPTNTIYREIINAPDEATRQQLYIDRLMQPWAQMMTTVAGMPDAGDDPLAGARAWNWLLPEHLTSVPEALAKLETADAWTVAAEAMTAGTARFTPYANQLGIDKIEGWLVLANPEASDPIMRGYTGATDFFQPRFIGQYDTVTDANLSRLPGLVVHEMHHLILRKAVPFNMMTASVADYIVMEGLAEAFAASLYGEDAITFFASEVDPGELEDARRLIGDGLDKTGFGVIRGYIFGDYWAEKMGFPAVGGMPTYGGYAVGYQVVKAYLERAGTSVEAATFVPATEIVRESGYFA
jgi:uncharacterized protein YjaZ